MFSFMTVIIKRLKNIILNLRKREQGANSFLTSSGLRALLQKQPPSELRMRVGRNHTERAPSRHLSTISVQYSALSLGILVYN